MQKITIKNESYPQRCEICHKSENFNSETNYCSLCQQGINNFVIDVSDKSNPKFINNRVNKFNKFFAGLLAAFVSFVLIYTIGYFVINMEFDIRRILFLITIIGWLGSISFYLIICLLMYIFIQNPEVRYMNNKKQAKIILYPLSLSTIGFLSLLKVYDDNNLFGLILIILMFPLVIVWSAAFEKNIK
jgi:hypothetical protein